MAARDKNGVNVYPGDWVHVDGVEEPQYVCDVDNNGVVIETQYLTYWHLNGQYLGVGEEAAKRVDDPRNLVVREESAQDVIPARMVEVDLERSSKIDRTIPYGSTIEITSVRIEGRIIEE